MPAGNSLGFDPSGGGDSVLPSRPTVGNTGVLPTSSGGGAFSSGNDSGGGSNWSKIGGLAQTALPGVLALFGGHDNKQASEATGATEDLRAMAQSLFGAGAKNQAVGADAMAPVLQYLARVAGGDPAALFGATQPERTRVLDQYDTARKSLMFNPRGGGQASATAALEASKASTLTSQTAAARTAGVQTAAALSSDLIHTGAQESAAGTADLARAINAFESQAKRTDEQQKESGSVWGNLLNIGLGALSFFSHSTLKDVQPTIIHPRVALDGIRELELRKWNYKGDPTTHLGPMAEDFHRIFGVGDGVTINVADVMGVCLAVTKAVAMGLK
jgi:hypothetical protein